MTEKEFKEAKVFIWPAGIAALVCLIMAIYFCYPLEEKNTQIISYLFLGVFVFTTAFVLTLTSIRKYKKIKQKREIKKNRSTQISGDVKSLQ